MTITASFSGGGKLSSKSFRKANRNQNQKQTPVNGSTGDSSTSNLPSPHHQQSSPRGSSVGKRQRGAPVGDAASPRARVPSTTGNPSPTAGARRGRPERFVPPSILILDNNSNDDSDNGKIGLQARERSLPPPRTRPLNDISPSASAALTSPPSSSTSAPVLSGARRRVSATNSSTHSFQQQQRRHPQQRRSTSMDHTPSGGRLEQQLHNLSARYSDPRQEDGNINAHGTRGENGGISASATVRSDPPKKRQPITINTGGVYGADATNGFRASASNCSSVGVSPRGALGDALAALLILLLLEMILLLMIRMRMWAMYQRCTRCT